MIVLLSILLAVQSAPQPKDMSYGEVYGCNRLAEGMKRHVFSGGLTPQTDSERALFDNLTQVETLAAAEMPSAQMRDGLDEVQAGNGRVAADQALGEADDDQLIGALEQCAAIFGVTFQ